MVEIKEGYKNQFNVALADDIKKNYTGNTAKILLALIKGKQIVWKDFWKTCSIYKADVIKRCRSLCWYSFN